MNMKIYKKLYVALQIIKKSINSSLPFVSYQEDKIISSIESIKTDKLTDIENKNLDIIKKELNKVKKITSDIYDIYEKLEILIEHIDEEQ